VAWNIRNYRYVGDVSVARRPAPMAGQQQPGGSFKPRPLGGGAPAAPSRPLVPGGVPPYCPQYSAGPLAHTAPRPHAVAGIFDHTAGALPHGHVVQAPAVPSRPFFPLPMGQLHVGASMPVQAQPLPLQNAPPRPLSAGIKRRRW
jgi:hypothetical protein